MAASSSSSAYSLLPISSPSNRHVSLLSSSFSFPQRLHSFSSLSFRVPHNPSPIRVLSRLHQSKASKVTGESWQTSILDSEGLVLVEFYASWCGPCQMVHRVIEEIATEYSSKLRCFVLNADQDPRITDEYDIKAVPVVLLFKNGEKCESVVGTMPKDFYVAAIERLLSS